MAITDESISVSQVLGAHARAAPKETYYLSPLETYYLSLRLWNAPLIIPSGRL